jgi:hypothetical protein
MDNGKSSRRTSSVIGLFSIVVFFASLTVSLAAQSKPAWQQEWEKTLEAAKKEGQVAVYISGYDAILPDFEKEFS